MNSSTMRCAAALLCATTLAACGGSGGGSIPMGGAILGLNRAGLVLQNQGKELIVTDSAVSFVFLDLVASDSEFEITVKTQPPGQVCTPSNNKGRANYYSYQQTRIICTTDPFILSGSVSGLGLKNAGLVLNNGNLTTSVAAGATSFTFGKVVPNGQTYGVTVLAQPEGKTCTVDKGTGTMPMADKDDVAIICN